MYMEKQEKKREKERERERKKEIVKLFFKIHLYIVESALRAIQKLMGIVFNEWDFKGTTLRS